MELILAIPIWLILAAAMIVVGDLGVWKLRGHSAVREAASRALWPRIRENETRPHEWITESASLDLHNTAPPIQIDPLLGHTVVRGPVIHAPNTTGSIPVDASVLHMTPEAVIGTAQLSESPRVWQRSGVMVRYDREYPIVNGRTGQWDWGDPPLRSLRIWRLMSLGTP